MNIVELFQQRAATHSDQPAIIDSQRVTTFAQLEAMSASIAAQLQRAGLRSGDTVLVFYPMSAELYVTLGAIFRLGLVAMFLDPSAGRDHLEQCCMVHAPQALIASAKAHLLRLTSPRLRRIRHKFVIEGFVPGATSLALNAAPETRIVATKPNDPALITFTSGSTGQPKATLRTHGFLLAQYAALCRSLNLTADECDLATLPVFVLANLAAGVTSVIPSADLRFPGALDPAPVVAQIEQYQLHSTAASPALLERMADYCLQQNLQLTSLQKVFTGGAPVFPCLLDKLRVIAPNARIVAVYGSTEAEPIAEIALDKIEAEDRAAMRNGRGLLAGQPVPEIQCRILRDQWGTPIAPLTQTEFDAAGVAPNEPGEIVVTGDHVLTGYLHGLGDEETKFKVDGKVWHRTGDAGYVDAQGRLWLLGRCAAKIVDARGTLYPFAVECAASHHPNVKRAALVQHKARRLLVVEQQGNDLNDLRDALAWAGIDELRVLKTIPVDKRHNAKVDYPALSKLLG